MLVSVLRAYGFNENSVAAVPFGSGLINHTWKLKDQQGAYILQRINTAVFKKPENIALNTRLIGDYLTKHHREYLFVTPLQTTDGKDFFYNSDDEGYYRLFPFVAGSNTETVADTPETAREAAIQFGKFTRLLAEFDISCLKTTLPGFHDLCLRYDEFLHAFADGNQERVRNAAAETSLIVQYSTIRDEYSRIQKDPAFRLRVTHHDTKISNVLFDDNGRGLCVIDLDTVMPGYFISDVGDMMRTYLSPVSEEETDLDRIEVRQEFFKAIVEGYTSEMEDELTAEEKSYFLFAGKFMTYMQAIRFLTDYFNDDRYYSASYPDHNLHRAKNQLMLLRKMMEKEEVLVV